MATYTCNICGAGFESGCNCDSLPDLLPAPPDRDLSPEQLDDKYNRDGYGGHPEYTREFWRHEAFEGDTLLGYWEWVYNQINDE